MNCFEVKRNIHLYLDREFGVREACEIEEHLKSCDRCREEYEYYTVLRSVLKRAFRKRTAPIYLKANIRNMLKKEEKRARNRKFSFLFGGAMAVAAALMLLLWPISNFPDESRQRGESSNYPEYLQQSSVKFSVGTPYYSSEIYQNSSDYSGFPLTEVSNGNISRSILPISPPREDGSCDVPSYSSSKGHFSKPLCSTTGERNLKISGSVTHFHYRTGEGWKKGFSATSYNNSSFP